MDVVAMIGRRRDARRVAVDERAGVAGRGFTWAFVGFASWLMAGAYVDAWAHHNIHRLETFFTPYHALLYSGMAAVATFLTINVVLHWRSYGTWQSLLPNGYGVSLVGAVLFAIGGGLDMLWHLAFGIELSVAALVSPTHLLLMLAGGLIVSGPLRADLRVGGRRASWPALISAGLVLAMIGFFFQFDHPYIDIWAAGASDPGRGPIWMEEELGIAGVIVYALAISAVLQLLVRRFELPWGGVTVMLVISSGLAATTMNHESLLLAAVLGGLAADILLATLRPSPGRVVAFRIFAFAAPASIMAAYMLTVAAMDGIWWPVHFWTGAVPIAGGAGWVLGFLALPGEAARARLGGR